MQKVPVSLACVDYLRFFIWSDQFSRFTDPPKVVAEHCGAISMSIGQSFRPLLASAWIIPCHQLLQVILVRISPANGFTFGHLYSFNLSKANYHETMADATQTKIYITPPVYLSYKHFLNPLCYMAHLRYRKKNERSLPSIPIATKQTPGSGQGTSRNGAS